MKPKARQYFEANLACSIYNGDTAIQTRYRQRLAELDRSACE